MLERIVFTKECGPRRSADVTSSARRTQHRGAAGAPGRCQPQFTALVRRIRDRNEWDDAFVDALCTPPVSFTFGSVVAHILTVGVVRRQTVIGALRDLGIADAEARDPIEWGAHDRDRKCVKILRPARHIHRPTEGAQQR
jgi:hypothetical protein